MKYKYLTIALLAVSALIWMGASESNVADTSDLPYTAYRGHGRDVDLVNALSVYPTMSGKPLDDCRMCHLTAFQKKNPSGACDTCHRILDMPEPHQTLNTFGLAYRDAGRNPGAFSKIADADSDGDGISNGAEILKGSFPGENLHVPGMKTAPVTTLTAEQFKPLPRHEQFLMLNTHKHNDTYGVYSGWLLTDILKAAGTDLTTVTGVTMISWDSFRKDFSIQDIHMKFPAPKFYGSFADPEFLNGCEQWVIYPSSLPLNVTDGKPIPGTFRMMLANTRDGKPMIPLPRSDRGKLQGEGGYRLIVPQKEPGPPDQIQKLSDPKYPHPFDESLDHNSGGCARAVIGIQVHPMPAGTTDPDWRSMTDEFYFNKKIIVFGNIAETGE